jgi:PleD family two-component response regulator
MYIKQDTFISKLYAFISTYFIPRKYNNIIPEPKPIITTTNIPINNSSNIKSVSSHNSLNSLNSLNSINEYIRVLIVDDSIVFGKILKHQLECDGCQVDLLSNGEDAYYILKNRIFSYDILIIDIFMPYMYGTYLIKQIRTEIKNMVPIIVLSSIPEFGNEVLELGANLFFEKGYPLNALKHDIANLLFSHITDSFIDK